MCMSTVLSAKVAVSHSHQLQEEHEEDGHQCNAFWPRVRDDNSSETFVRECFICGCQQMNEGSSDDDTRAKILCNEEERLGYA